MGIDSYIGLPPGFDPDRRATIHGRSKHELLLHAGEMPRRLLLEIMKPHSLANRQFDRRR